jgi:PRTRC genetic system ThiF family protein
MNTPFPISSSLPQMVVPYQSEYIQLIVVGAGGTGSWLIPHLARLVWDFNRTWEQIHDEKPRRASLLIVDHDTVEDGNIRARQNFCPAEIGYPKAQVLANRLAFAFGLDGKEISASVGQFSHSHVGQRWGALTIICGCVDNAGARAEIARCLDRESGRNEKHAPLTWWVDAGNALNSGQVLCGNAATAAQLQGALAGPFCLRLPSPALLHPELLEPRPEELVEASAQLSCKDLVLAGEPAMRQSRTINSHMASLAYGYVEHLVYGGLTTFATYTDNSTFTTRSLETTPEGFSQALGMPATFFTAFPQAEQGQNPAQIPDEEDEFDEDDVTP